MGEVIHVPPKRTVEFYRGIKIEYTYDPDHKMWGYRFVKIQEFVFEDNKPTLDVAMREAHKKVDKLAGD